MNSFVTKPLYSQVRDALADKIFDGSWQSGTPIPNEVDLAKDFGVSVGTMRKALSMLEYEGLVTRRQGRGTFVADPNSPSSRDKFDHLFRKDGSKSEPDVRQIGCKEQVASSEQQEQLAISDADEVVVCQQVVRIDNKPTIYREAHFARKRLPYFDFSETWDVFNAAKKHGLWVGGGIEKLYLKQPEPQVAKALGLDAAVTLLVLDRIVFALDGKPLEWLVSWSEFSGLYYGITFA